MRAMTKADARDDSERALGILLANDMMRSIARGGRFRVLVNDRIVVEPPDPLAGRHLRCIDLVDYTSDRAVTACVDLDRGGLTSLRCAPAEQRFAPAEEDDAISVALADRRVAAGITLGDRPQSIIHVAPSDGHRSAAISFGAPFTAPSLVAIVDLARRAVTRIVPSDGS